MFLQHRTRRVNRRKPASSSLDELWRVMGWRREARICLIFGNLQLSQKIGPSGRLVRNDWTKRAGKKSHRRVGNLSYAVTNNVWTHYGLGKETWPFESSDTITQQPFCKLFSLVQLYRSITLKYL